MKRERLRVPTKMQTELSVEVVSTDDPEQRREIDLCVFECPRCQGSVGVDLAFVDPVTEFLLCIYCGNLLYIEEE